MSERRWDAVVALFERVLDAPPAERDRIVAEVTGQDPELGRRVAALLRADAASHPLLESTPRTLAEAVAPAHGRREGTRIGPYTVLRELGRGGMGAVYLAERADVDKRVALKLVSGLASEALVERFLVERRVLAQLEHPNIARLLDAGVADDGTPWLAMDYVDGRPIDAWCDERRADVPTRLALFEQVCETVAYAHRNLVVHRDLKPSNILVTPAGEPKLVDFGIAKLLDDSDRVAALTREGPHPLTPRYASPEQLAGEAITTATDVWQLGVLLYELVAGRHPHADAPDATLRARVLEGVAPLPPSRAAAVEPGGGAGREEPIDAVERAARRGTTPERLGRRLQGDVDAIALMAMRPEPARRYASAQQMADDVHRHLAGVPVAAGPDTLRYRWAKFVRRNRMTVAASVVVAVSLVAAMAGMTWQARRATRQARLAAEERDRAGHEAAKAERVATFLTDLFEGASPAQALGRDVTAREILDEGARRLGDGGELADQPELRAELLGVLGDVYLKLGWNAEARRLDERALALLRESAAPTSADLASALSEMGTLELSDGKPDAARPLFEESLAIRRAADPPDPGAVAEAVYNLATVHAANASLDTAETLLRDALGAERLAGASDWEALAATLSTLGSVLSRAGRLEAADSFHTEALAIERARREPRHPELARSLNNVGTTRLRRGDPAGAEPYLREALEIWRVVLGHHPDVAIALNNLGSSLERQGKLEEAEAAYRESLAMKRELIPGDHTSVAFSLNNLGLLLVQRGRLDEAEGLLAESLAMRRRLQGEDHPDVANAYHSLAELRARQGRLALAAAGFQRALDIRRGRLPEGHRLTLRSALGLARVVREQGDSARANALLEEVLRVGSAAAEPDTALLGEARRLLVATGAR